MIIVSGFNHKQKQKLNDILKKLISFFGQQEVNDSFRKVILDNSLITNNKQKIAGRFNKKEKILKVNPEIFDTEDFSDTQNRMSKLEHLIYHEFGHALDNKYGFSNDKYFLRIAGWTKDKNVNNTELNINKNERWFYDPDYQFSRWYAKTSPRENLAEDFAFYFGGLYNRLDERALNYIKEKIQKIKK